MKPLRGAPRRNAELDRLRKLLSVREKQFQVACQGLKNIVQFESAHLSVFETEVHTLQARALNTLVEMENAQRDTKRRLVTPALRRKVPKVLQEVPWQPLYGPAPAQRVRLEDEDV